MSSDPSAADFRRRLRARVREYVRDAATPFDAVSLDEDVGEKRAAIVVESARTGGLAVVVTSETAGPLAADVVERACEYAAEAGVDHVATCNARDLFLFADADAAAGAYYYLDFRPVDLGDPTLDGRLPALLDAVRSLAADGTLPEQAARKRLLGTVQSFHGAVWPRLRTLARDSYETNPSFTAGFDAWVEANDYAPLDADARFTLAAKQYAYLLATEALFLDVLCEQPPDSAEPGVTVGSLVDGVAVDSVEHHLEGRCELDHDPEVESGRSLFASFPHDADTRTALGTLLDRLDATALSDVEEDVLGELYERLVPASERKAQGQFYTHPDVAAAICDWTLQSDGDRVPRVLDPASGSGTFPVEAYHRIRDGSSTATHQEALDNLVAGDVNRFPLRLTALNLSSRTVREQTEAVHTLADSFFDVSPRDERLPDAGTERRRPGSFDAVVGNPPYIRQEDLSPDKVHFREHLRAYGPEGATPYYSGAGKLSKQSDAYVYFVTHALRFLREGGRLGVVVPTKWLTTKYGESFQEFLYDQTKVHAVVGFADRAFSALVDTVLLFVEKCADERARRETTTDFVRVKERLPPETLASVAGSHRSVPDDRLFDIETHDEYRVTSVPQQHLAEQGGQKLGYYLYGPSPFVPLVNSEKTRRLDAFADVAFGNKTGHNGFFLLDESDVAQWGVDERFLRPAIRSIRDIDSARLDETGQYLLDFHEYVEAFEADRTGLRSTPDLAAAVKDQLREDGYHSTLRYLEYGEDEGVPDGRTVSTHTPWFNLGELLVPDVLHPVFYNERVFTVENAGGFAPTNAIQCVDVTDHENVLPHVLNSTVYKILLELWGRHEGGGALQLLTYEVASVPVPNPDLMSDDTRDRISRAGRALVRGERGVQDGLDAALLDFLELDMSPGELQAAHRGMVRQRVDGAASENVQVRAVDDLDDYDLDSLIPEFEPESDYNASLREF
ncbi:N-6 DNA methylase [Halomicroarcula sp. S1AR25-4]|uniref:Eco57I restriction-modification methylase domain-containing protein n=1 Tax=Haloarcula sp. S1AR25-4 TaxID=2950538 RepID=UPI00287432A8|nr:N-6 DNA methylase [Halomicroarcula sp. S1AR25-4]MDS0278173.1 N-6 DNA methylase [Halomicroarcula sp. S1AR25-4]